MVIHFYQHICGKKIEAAHTCSLSERKEYHEFEAILGSKKEREGGRSEGDTLLYLLGGFVEDPLTLYSWVFVPLTCVYFYANEIVLTTITFKYKLESQNIIPLPLCVPYLWSNTSPLACL